MRGSAQLLLHDGAPEEACVPVFAIGSTPSITLYFKRKRSDHCVLLL
jgi:hypothetical protein